MCTRKSFLTIVAAAVLGVLISVSAHAWQTDLSYLTFNGPVALPGVTLPAGTYEFRSVSPMNKDLVQVLNRDHSKSYFLGVTLPIARPDGDRNRQVTLGETAPGQPASIMAWFPRDQATGHMFLYDR